MSCPQRWMERDEDTIIYSDEEPEQSDWRSEEEAEENEWGIDWDEMECIDEYGEDGVKETKLDEDEPSQDELDDLLLDPVDELLDAPASKDETERGNRWMDDKKESDEEGEGGEGEEGDPWSRWVGMDGRHEKEKEEKEREEQGRIQNKDEKRNEWRRDERKPTLAELVLKGKLSEEEATRDKKNGGRRRSPPRWKRERERSPPRRIASPMRRREERRKRSPSPSPSPDRRRTRASPMRKEKRSPMKEGKGISPSHEKRMDRSSRRIRSPCMERRRNGSPTRKEPRVSPSRRDNGSSQRRRREGDTHPPSSPFRSKMRRDRSSLPSLPSLPRERDTMARPSSPHRRTMIRCRSPVIGKREVMPKRGSPNGLRLSERRERSMSPIVSPRTDLPSLLDVKILPLVPPRMEGRVKREERQERQERQETQEKETHKERIEMMERDEREGREGRDKKMDEKKDERREEERKRHIPIVWNATDTHSKKIHRSIGHVEGIEMTERKRKDEEQKEEEMKKKKKKKKKERERTVGMAMIPFSMMGRIGTCGVDAIEQPRRTGGITLKGEMEPNKRLHFVESSSLYGTSTQKEQIERKRLESIHGRPQPKELVRIIRNDEAVIGSEVESKQMRRIQLLKERREDYDEERVEEEAEDEDEGGWLSTRLQEGVNGMVMERGDRRCLNPEAAAARVFDRAAASAASSSSLRDAKPIITEERCSREAIDSFGEEKGGKRMKHKRRSIQERIQILPPNLQSGKAKRKHRNRSGDKLQVSQQSGIRLLECYY